MLINNNGPNVERGSGGGDGRERADWFKAEE